MSETVKEGRTTLYSIWGEGQRVKTEAEGTASAKTQRRDHICHVQDHVAGRTAWQKQCGRVTGIGQRGQGTQVPQGMWGFGSFFARRWGATGGLGAEE